MSTRSPGPWKVTSAPGGWDGVADEQGRLICTLSLNEPSHAHLIAAAPRMLAFIKENFGVIAEFPGAEREALDIIGGVEGKTKKQVLDDFLGHLIPKAEGAS